MLRAFRNASKKLQPLARAKPQRRQYTIEELSGNKWLFPDEDTSRGTHSHKSTAMSNIKKMPIVEVDSDVVRTNGGKISYGHPQVYYQLDTATGGPVTCKYSGLRFQMRHHH